MKNLSKSLRNFRTRRLRRLMVKLQKLWQKITLSELYELYENVNDEHLKKEIEQRILKMAIGDDDVLEIVINERDPLRAEAWRKLNSRIQNGKIKKSRARQILKRVMSVPKLRNDAWKLFTKSDPSNEELKEIQRFDFIYSTPSIAHDIEKLLRKKHKKRNCTSKIIEDIQKTTEKINKLKKGQK